MALYGLIGFACGLVAGAILTEHGIRFGLKLADRARQDIPFSEPESIADEDTD